MHLIDLSYILDRFVIVILIQNIFIAAVARLRSVVTFKFPKTRSIGNCKNFGEGPDLHFVKGLSLLPPNYYPKDLCSGISIFFAL